MIFLIAVLIVVVALVGVRAEVLHLRHCRHRELMRPQYEHINELELELGLGLSDYRREGVDSPAILAADAERKLKEFERDNEVFEKEFEETLDPELAIKRRIASAFAVPTHILGRSHKSVDEIASELEHTALGDTHARLSPSMRKLCHAIARRVAEATVAGGDPMMVQPMDEPYPIEIITPSRHHPSSERREPSVFGVTSRSSAPHTTAAKRPDPDQLMRLLH